MANGKLPFMYAAVFLAVCCVTTSRRVMHMFHYDKEPMESDSIPEGNVGLVL